MAQYTKQLHFLRNGTQNDITLYTSLSDVVDASLINTDGTTGGITLYTSTSDVEYPYLRLMDGDTPVYAALELLTASNTSESGLKVSGGGNTYVVKALPPKGKALNEYTWKQISKIALAGKGAEYFSVGDTKEVVLNGNTTDSSNAIKSFNNYSCKATILGFDHNASLENNGEHSIHFILGKDSTSKDIMFWSFQMNESSTTSGGWNGSKMKNTTMVEFKNCLPAELRAVLRDVTKYTHNTTGGSGNDSSSNVTATTEQVFLLSEFEVFGARTRANSYEKDKQAQYDYYKNGNSKVRYRDDSPTSANSWWLRSAICSAALTGHFCFVGSSGSTSASDAFASYGIAPAFVV